MHGASDEYHESIGSAGDTRMDERRFQIWVRHVLLVWTLTYLSEGLAEIVREESIQDWVDARVRVGEDMRHDLKRHSDVCVAIQLERFQHQNDLQRDLNLERN